MATETKPTLVVWMSCGITGTLIAWLATGIAILCFLQGTNRSDAETIAELTGQKDPPELGVVLKRDDYAYAFVPFYFLGSQERNTGLHAPVWVRERHQSNKTFLVGLHLLRLVVVAVGGYAFANKYCGRHPLVQGVVAG